MRSGVSGVWGGIRPEGFQVLCRGGHEYGGLPAGVFSVGAAHPLPHLASVAGRHRGDDRATESATGHAGAVDVSGVLCEFHEQIDGLDRHLIVVAQ